ncbi:two-component regulator propeller domain-containing protein [Flavobacterium sp. H122]|uniref:type IX secretion system anionic LPS delivery protein PorZ n=1 Tax=Flavobacterium sp. H122 TaxID=2529860 RepID=UPI0010A9B6F1|nr:T9SS type A sorting domain-containing protein [Flavobacterium sp. H122]
MRKLLLFLICFCFVNTIAQNNEQWQGYFSYNNVKDIVAGDGKIFVAADNSYFIKDILTNEVRKITTVEGLSGDSITRMHYSAQYKKIIIGHSNGLIIVVNETDGSMFSLMGIVEKPTIPIDKKRINHFEEFNGKIYISTNYGITVLDLNTSQFGDTYFIGPNGSSIEVFQTAVFNDTIYAITNNYGLLKANVSNPFLIDYNQWTMAASGSWKLIETTPNKIYLINIEGSIFEIDAANNLIAKYSLPQSPKDFKISENNLIVTENNYIQIFDEFLNKTFEIDNSVLPNFIFSTAIVLSDQIYIGTENDGLKTCMKSSNIVYEDLTPDGPVLNKIFKINKTNSNLWAVYGGYTKQYNPYTYCCGRPSEYGVNKFDVNKKWNVISNQEIMGIKAVSSVVENPINENEVYFGSFFSGLLKMENDLPQVLYNQTNSTLDDDLIPNVTLVNSLNFDYEGNLWLTNSRVNNAVNVYKKNGEWASYSLQNITNRPSDDSYSSLVVDRNGTKWIGSYRNGVIAFNEKLNKFIVINSNLDGGGLPDNDVRSLVIDNNNQLWIGTFSGLRVLPNINSFLNETKLKTKPIIILQDNVAQELFYRFNVLDIALDGSNYKWVSAENSGVYLVSPDGQKTIHHFTKDNSPLPSDNVLDIDIDNKTGEVFFATDKGLVSFKGVSTAGTSDYSNTYVYPNPYRPEHNNGVKITGLKDKSNVKITDIEGNLVFETISEGGTVEWDTRSFNKKLVSSGVYMVMISDEEGLDTGVKKIMIIR